MLIARPMVNVKQANGAGSIRSEPWTDTTATAGSRPLFDGFAIERPQPAAEYGKDSIGAVKGSDLPPCDCDLPALKIEKLSGQDNR
jgi:hypothetical protein